MSTPPRKKVAQPSDFPPLLLVAALVPERAQPVAEGGEHRGLDFLQADDVWLGPAQPSDQVGQPLVDIVDVEAGDLHANV